MNADISETITDSEMLSDLDFVALYARKFVTRICHAAQVCYANMPRPQTAKNCDAQIFMLDKKF